GRWHARFDSRLRRLLVHGAPVEPAPLRTQIRRHHWTFELHLMNKLTLLLGLVAAALILFLLLWVIRDPRPSAVSSGNERGALVKDLKPRFLSVWSQAGITDQRIIELAAAVEQRNEDHCIVQEAKKRGIALLEAKPIVE